MLPGVSEGVLPPNAEPVTAHEAMHHLAKQVINELNKSVQKLHFESFFASAVK